MWEKVETQGGEIQAHCVMHELSDTDMHQKSWKNEEKKNPATVPFSRIFLTCGMKSWSRDTSIHLNMSQRVLQPTHVYMVKNKRCHKLILKQAFMICEACQIDCGFIYSTGLSYTGNNANGELQRLVAFIKSTNPVIESPPLSYRGPVIFNR